MISLTETSHISGVSLRDTPLQATIYSVLLVHDGLQI